MIGLQAFFAAAEASVSASQGGQGMGRGSPGDLYLYVEMLPHPLYRTDGCDVMMDLPITPWAAALGAEVVAPKPAGQVEVNILADTSAKAQAVPSKSVVPTV